MEPLAQGHEQLVNDLLELGFTQPFINKSLQLTNDKEKAVELILKFQEEEDEFQMKKALEFSEKTQNNKISPENNSNNMSNPPINSDPKILADKILENINNSNQNLAKNMANDDDNWYFPKNDFKMVILVRSDLKMGVGKIAAQVGHAVLGAYKNALNNKNSKNLEDLDFWEEYGQAKVVLRVNSKDELLDMENKAKAIGLNTCVICDAGRTQIDPGTMTVCAIGPAEKSIIDGVTKHLKLL